MQVTLDDVRTLSQYLAPLLLLALASVVAVRSGSLHTFWDRLWRLTIGKRQYLDPKVAQYIEQQHSISAFRFYSGLSPRTQWQMSAVIDLMDAHDLSQDDIRACGTYFNYATTRVDTEKLPSENAMRWRRGLAVGLYLLMVASFLGIFYAPGVLVQFKESSNWFVLERDGARKISQSNTLTPALCVAGGASSTQGFSAREKALLCEAFDGDWKSFQASEMRKQRIAGVALAVILFLMPLIWLVRRVTMVVRARQLAERIFGSSPESSLKSRKPESPEI